ncbi:RuBisCO large subunit C-terminal-like domain-containing protein [Cryobacterium sp. Y62]|uniref:RuBisCO large subunit C-terminal-like domain-containing protein n=1 Tax=Cryobacterium sp. Y62 TaxID=2048284 RepID=UPI001E4597AD|nr:RuBisCO large subunit C-terminal-like domain-containing protein [Cryobacterium sp. Y62]
MTLRDPRSFTCVYRIESPLELDVAASILAGEQSSGTFVQVPGETVELHERFGARVIAVHDAGRTQPSLPSRIEQREVSAGEVTIEFPMEAIGTDFATLLTAIGGNLFELGDLTGCRLESIDLPPDFINAHPGPEFGVPGTRRLIGNSSGVLVGTIIKPNVGLAPDDFRSIVRELTRASVDFIKDDELMTDPKYLPLSERVKIAQQEILAASETTGRQTMYAFNITGDLGGLRRRHDEVIKAGGTCVMLNVPIMGLPALAWLRSFSEVPIHAHRAGLAASMRHPALGMSYGVWQKLVRLAGADQIHVSGLGSKFYETDKEVATNIGSLQLPLGDTLNPLPVLSSGQNVHTPEITYASVKSQDLLMLAGGGVAAHPEGPAAGVRSLRQAWEAAVSEQSLPVSADRLAASGDSALSVALRTFKKP